MSILTPAKWFRRNTRTTALVQAPSADLIAPDTGPRIPEPQEIKCDMTIEQFEGYLTDINYSKDTNAIFNRECLRQTLKVLGYRRYPSDGVIKLLISQSKRLKEPFGSEWYKWNIYSNYYCYVPPRIVNGIEAIKNHHFSPPNIFFWVSDLIEYNTDFINTRQNTEICFLAATEFILKDYQVNQYAFIIDVWRGPTFSDEEAKI